MVKETKYGIIKQIEFPVRELLMVPHRGGDLMVSYPAFGLKCFKNNVQEMKKSYLHPETGDIITFREPTTSKSISAAVYGFGSGEEVDAKRDILDDPKLLQLGSIVRTSEGVFTNLHETDEKMLKLYLSRAEKVNGIYLGDQIAFAPYETFKQGVQEYGDFAESGLARALEHTKEKTARNLKEIASPKFYKRGVNVRGFSSVKKPVLKIASLLSGGCFPGQFGVGRLGLCSRFWISGEVGYAFGVLG